MRSRTVTLLASLFVGILITVSCTPAAPEDISSLLEPIRQEYNLPALAAAVVLDGETVALGAVGERKFASGVQVTIDDQFHLGSCGKAMTATLLATLVEQGKLNWTTTLEDIFPELADDMWPDYRSVTPLHLLSHHAGLPGKGQTWPPGTDGSYWQELTGPVEEQRYTYLKMMTCRELDRNEQLMLPKPGTMALYSNAGLVIAGAVAERVTGSSWEELMQEMIFGPLGMTTVGFGAMGTAEEIAQPWQHVFQEGEIYPVTPGPRSDNPTVIGPAGRIHCSIGDWARFIAAHLEGRHGRSSLLKQETFETLHTLPFGGDYALGWGVVRRDWAGGTALTHTGSNGGNYALVWLAPQRDFAVIVATNIGSGDEALEALNEATDALIDIYLPTD